MRHCLARNLWKAWAILVLFGTDSLLLCGNHITVFIDSMQNMFIEFERPKMANIMTKTTNMPKLVMGPRISLVINAILLCFVASLTTGVDPQEQKKQQDRASLL